MPDDSKESRLKKRQDDGISIDMPDIEGFETILDHLSELGYVNSGMNGAIPLSFSDVDAWNRCTGGFTDQWVVQMLVHLSRDYCYQMNSSSDKMCKPPYVMETDDYDLKIVRENADKKLKAMFM